MWLITSTSPRNMITATTVASSETGTLQRLPTWKTTYSAGLVKSATTVAARVSLRHS